MNANYHWRIFICEVIALVAGFNKNADEMDKEHQNIDEV